jgi:hypothetical protein
MFLKGQKKSNAYSIQGTGVLYACSLERHFDDQ